MINVIINHKAAGFPAWSQLKGNAIQIVMREIAKITMVDQLIDRAIREHALFVSTLFHFGFAKEFALQR